ncbi:major tail protein [Listeria phage LP-032]|uniref:Major tail protein n=9 Tax=Homburgvirus TaxID=1921125 RepID=A0A5A4K6P1_9CAUD|nr:major tail protein [Listeria phage P70]YP_008240442.1 major tail protein [Listeria phage LP-110]YP_008240584.1 major tail protein [Listeria phage LP-037]YP_009044195.1 major tail protein [Listeria phage LP-026]AHL18901.1 major tail protein [Listeria phage LP-032]AWY07660.1 major tail protein [Listeria phage LP-KV022]QDK04526.1 hypothetical protein FK481_0012 [Listeria phage LP-010]QDK04634.1 hypothetical protein FK482_0012 [Listeria phage LP-013]QDK04745.1 hypothetical protein FK484_0012
MVQCASNFNRGVEIIIKVDDPNNAGAMIAVGYQRGGTINREADTIDASSKEDFGWGSSEYGVRTWSIDLDGLLVGTDEGQKRLRAAFTNKECVSVEVSYPDGGVEYGTAILTTFNSDFPYDDIATFEGTLTGRGELYYTEPPIVNPTTLTTSALPSNIAVNTPFQIVTSIQPTNAPQGTQFEYVSGTTATDLKVEKISGTEAYKVTPLKTGSFGVKFTATALNTVSQTVTIVVPTP